MSDSKSYWTQFGVRNLAIMNDSIPLQNSPHWKKCTVSICSSSALVIKRMPFQRPGSGRGTRLILNDYFHRRRGKKRKKKREFFHIPSSFFIKGLDSSHSAYLFSLIHVFISSIWLLRPSVSHMLFPLAAFESTSFLFFFNGTPPSAKSHVLKSDCI